MVHGPVSQQQAEARLLSLSLSESGRTRTRTRTFSSMGLPSVVDEGEGIENPVSDMLDMDRGVLGGVAGRPGEEDARCRRIFGWRVSLLHEELLELVGVVGEVERSRE